MHKINGIDNNQDLPPLKDDPKWIVYAAFFGLGIVMGMLFAQILHIL